MKKIIIVASILLALGVASVSAQEIDPTGQPGGPMRAVTSCSNWQIGDAALVGLVVLGIAFVPRRKKCWREEFYGKGITCKQQKKKGAEVCQHCR